MTLTVQNSTPQVDVVPLPMRVFPVHFNHSLCFDLFCFASVGCCRKERTQDEASGGRPPPRPPPVCPRQASKPPQKIQLVFPPLCYSVKLQF